MSAWSFKNGSIIFFLNFSSWVTSLNGFRAIGSCDKSNHCMWKSNSWSSWEIRFARPLIPENYLCTHGLCRRYSRWPGDQWVYHVRGCNNTISAPPHFEWFRCIELDRKWRVANMPRRFRQALWCSLYETSLVWDLGIEASWGVCQVRSCRLERQVRYGHREHLSCLGVVPVSLQMSDHWVQASQMYLAYWAAWYFLRK